MNKALTLRTGRRTWSRYMKPLLERIQKGEIDPSFIISHRSTNLEEGRPCTTCFRDKKDNCTKVVFKPHADAEPGRAKGRIPSG